MMFVKLPISTFRENEIPSIISSYFLISELKSLNLEDLTQEQTK